MSLQILQIAGQNPDQWISVIIQKANGSLQAESIVEQLGGAITNDLHIIDAFAAEMRAGSALELARSDGVRWVSLDAPMQPTALEGSTVRDEFSDVSYTNNNGTQNWSTGWAETGDGIPSPSSGYVRVSNLFLENLAFDMEDVRALHQPDEVS